MADMPALYRNPPRVKVRDTVDYTLQENTVQYVEWNYQVYDSAGMWSPADPIKIHCVADGLYHLNYAGWFEEEDTGSRRIEIHKFPTGGTISTVGGPASIQGSSVRLIGSVDLELEAGEYLAMAVKVWQSGQPVVFRALSSTPSLSLRWVAPHS